MKNRMICLREDLFLFAAGCGFLVYLLVSVAIDLVALIASGIASIGRALKS